VVKTLPMSVKLLIFGLYNNTVSITMPV